MRQRMVNQTVVHHINLLLWGKIRGSVNAASALGLFERCRLRHDSLKLSAILDFRHYDERHVYMRFAASR
jgi:hypothetical protein